MPRWCRRFVVMVPHMLGPLLGMGPCCKWQSVANEPPTLSSPKGGAQSLCVLGCEIGGRCVHSTAVQQAIGHTALGRARAVPGPSQSRVPAFDEVMALAPADSVKPAPALR